MKVCTAKECCKKNYTPHDFMRVAEYVFAKENARVKLKLSNEEQIFAEEINAFVIKSPDRITVATLKDMKKLVEGLMPK